MGGLLCSDLEEELEGILRKRLDERLPSEARSLLIHLQYKSGVALSALFPGHATMAPGLYRVMAASVLLLHAAYIAWVIFGAFFTRGRPRLATLHVATLVYGMVIEIFGFWCPLTALET